jgi:hypothetical protein
MEFGHHFTRTVVDVQPCHIVRPSKLATRSHGGDWMKLSARQSDRQKAQRAIVEQARGLPGVADVLDVYGRVSQYTDVLVNVQPSQVRNATGGNS